MAQAPDIDMFERTRYDDQQQRTWTRRQAVSITQTPGTLPGTERSLEMFEKWMKEIDNWVWQLVGCSVHDLPDCRFMDWFEDGITPKIAARRAIKEAW